MKIVKEPLFVFLLIGSGLFGLNYLVNDGEEEDTENVIRIEAGETTLLMETFKKQWNRPPNEFEAQNLVDSYVREQIFYREALALGLDKDDSVVRRRMVQKMEFLYGGISDQVEPTLDELSKFYVENADNYSVPGNISFVHVYLDPTRHGDTLASEIEKLEATLAGTLPDDAVTIELGDSLMLPLQLQNTSIDQIARMFGTEFAEQLTMLGVGEWAGPVQSGYGLHFVYISNRSERKIPPLDAVVDKVTADFEYSRRKENEQKILEKLKARYEIIVEQQVKNP